MSYKEVMGNSGLVRDMESKAILNVDQQALETYKAKKKALMSKQEEIENLKSEVSEIKSDISQIKELLLKVLEER